MAARLKVFVTSDGLTDFVVAASSRPKALAAWGSHQDLFETGLAHETDDPELVKAATAHPGEVLRRPAGSRAELENIKPARRVSKSKPRTPSPAALAKVAAAEASLAALDSQHERLLAELEARRATAKAAYARARDKLEAALIAARRALG